jgi:putative phage-type endonuclease
MNKLITTKYSSQLDWIKARRYLITGTDAGIIMGVNKYCDINELLTIKLDDNDMFEDVDNKFMKYGRDAEGPLYELFKADYGDMYHIGKHPAYTIITSTDKKLIGMGATLDGILVEKKHKQRPGILEIKTVNVINERSLEHWQDNHMPPSYYYQIMHYLMVTGFKFAMLKAQFKAFADDGTVELRTHHYYVPRDSKEIKKMYKLEKEFIDEVEKNREKIRQVR